MTTTLTAEQIAELEALLEKATPGPWKPDKYYCYIFGPKSQMVADGDLDEAHQDDGEPVIRARGVGGRLPINDNMDLVAALRNAAPALIAMAKRVSRFEQILSTTAGNRMTHIQVAARVRMLLRTDLDHEAVCENARDRIVLLADRCGELNERAEKAEAERDQIRATASRLADRLYMLVTSDCVEDDDLIAVQQELAIPEVATLLSNTAADGNQTMGDF